MSDKQYPYHLPITATYPNGMEVTWETKQDVVNAGFSMVSIMAACKYDGCYKGIDLVGCKDQTVFDKPFVTPDQRAEEEYETEEAKSAREVMEERKRKEFLGEAKASAKGTKMDQVYNLVNSGLSQGRSRQEIIQQIMDEIGMSKGGASTYYAKAKKQITEQ